jgi:hypothetical protein
MGLLRYLVATLEQKLLQSPWSKEGFCVYGHLSKKTIWKKRGDVNLEIAGRTISLTVGACSNTIRSRHGGITERLVLREELSSIIKEILEFLRP